MSTENIEEKIVGDSNIGSVKIANDVVATIAGLAASKITGVTGMSGGVAGGIAELLGRKNLTKGVKVVVSEDSATIDAYIIIEYGSSITKVATEVQESIKEAVETMTGLHATAVNVHVQGVAFPHEQPSETAEQ